MSWSLSFQLLPGETVIEDSSALDRDLVKPVYSVFLTDRRVIFRFNGFGSSLCKSFPYGEIREVQQVTRLFVGYLKVSARAKEELFNVSDAEYLVGRIRELKERFAVAEPAPAASLAEESPEAKRKVLLDMLVTLNKNGLLSDEELARKVEQLDVLDP